MACHLQDVHRVIKVKTVSQRILRVVGAALIVAALVVHAIPTKSAVNDIAIRVNKTLSPVADYCDSDGAVPFLRAYNPKITDHYYTDNGVEMEIMVSQHGYKSEGDAGYVYKTNKTEYQVPFYVYYSAGGTDHFYTLSGPESDFGDWKYQGIAAYVYSEQVCGSIPLYRMYNPNSADHFYTTSATERDNAIDNDGYVDEGVACYIFPVPASQ